MQQNPPVTIDEYIAACPKEVQPRLTQLRLPFSQPLPLSLLSKMVAFRVKEQETRHAQKLTGQKEPPRPLRARHEMPNDVAQMLENEGLMKHYAARPPYQRNDYIGWITRAKQDATRQKRIGQMLEELRAGDAYMGQSYRAKQVSE